jgi:16S rRNA (adenine1518-N6/adenine1519-N6)-dimethyltransferase
MMSARTRSHLADGGARTPRPRRRFGQHFLEPAWVAKLVEVIAPSPDDRFLEIGPGRGAITRPLAGRAARVVAIEVDRDLARDLRSLEIPNVSVIEADVLEVDLEDLAARELDAAPTHRARVVGNLPYNISSPILFRLLEASVGGRFSDATLMLQTEVADRLVAAPGSGEYGVLSVLTAVDADVAQVLVLPPGAFRPMPKVRSAVVRLTFREPRVTIADREVFTQLVRSMFTQRRKIVGNAVHAFAATRGTDARDALAEAGIDAQRRPETLDLTELARLAGVFASR